MNAATWVALVASLGSITAVGGLFLIPRQRRKIIADTNNVDVSTASAATETGLRSLQAALQETEKRAESLTATIAEMERVAEIERRLSQQRILQLLDDIRERDNQIRQRDAMIVRLGGQPPMD